MKQVPAIYEDKALQKYIKEIEKIPLLTPEEEQELARRYYETKDPEAAKKLILSNLRFVVKIAMEYRNYGVRLLDLIQEGNLGLMTALKKFDPYKGYRFITYAVWWIRAYIQRYILKNLRIVGMGTTETERKLIYKLGPVKNALMLQSGEEVSSEDVAKELGVSAKDVEEMETRLFTPDLSLDAEVDDEGRTRVEDLFASDTGNQEDFVIEKERKEKLKEKLARAKEQLKDRERLILEKRLLAEKPMTLQELADQLGISRERVRQIEKRTLEKLRNMMGDLEDER